MINYDDYDALKAKALSGAQEDIDNLAEWFEEYGEEYWNTECFDTDEFKIYPVYVDVDGNEDFEDDGDVDIFIDHYEIIYY